MLTLLSLVVVEVALFGSLAPHRVLTLELAFLTFCFKTRGSFEASPLLVAASCLLGAAALLHLLLVPLPPHPLGRGCFRIDTVALLILLLFRARNGERVSDSGTIETDELLAFAGEAGSSPQMAPRRLCDCDPSPPKLANRSSVD